MKNVRKVSQDINQDINRESNLGSIETSEVYETKRAKPLPARLTFGFRLGGSIILNFPKRTFVHLFRTSPLKRKGDVKYQPGKMKDEGGELRKVGPINSLYSRKGRKEERNAAIGRRGGKRLEPDRFDDQKKENEIRVWPKKKQRYGYDALSPSIKKTISKELQASGAFKHPKHTRVVNNVFRIKRPAFFNQTKVFEFLFEKYRYNAPKSNLLKKALPAVRPSLNYLVMHYLLNTKKQMHLDPALVLKNFVAPGAVELSTMKRSNVYLDKRMRSRIAFFLESSTSERKSLTAAKNKKGLAHFISQSNDLRFAGTKKPTISLFPFFGATFFFLRDGFRVYKKFRFNEQLLSQLKEKCLNLLEKDKGKVGELRDKLIDRGEIGELRKGVKMIQGILLKNERIPYGHNHYLNEVQEIRSLLYNRTKTNTLIESVKIKSVYQSASPIVQDISLQPKQKRGDFSSIFSNILKRIPAVMKCRIAGIRICCSGRLQGAEIARTECGKYGKTSCNTFDRKIDYASADVSTRHGIIGVKVWISYRF